jgi:adenylate cyclase 10
MPYSASKLDTLQKAVKLMQNAIYNTEGTLRQFIIDDKGSVLIAAFGLPPLSHEDDPARALRSVFSIIYLILTI